MIKRILAHSVLYFFATYMPILANIILLPFITVYLGTDDYAIYGLTYGYIGLIQAFSDLGFMQHFQNDYYKKRDTYKTTWSLYMGFLQGFRVIYAIVVAVLLYFLFRNHIENKIW